MSTSNQAYIDAVLAKCEALKSAQLWSPEPIVRPRAWLHNFEIADRTAAALLLDSFVFFSETRKQRLLRGAFEAAVRIPQRSPAYLSHSQLSAAVFTPVVTAKPNPTDSGFTMSRSVRQQLGVAESRFVGLQEALVHAANGDPVVFIDDVTITGDQFLETWRSVLPNGDSFARLAQRRPDIAVRCFYILATEDARTRIETEASPARVVATHSLDDSHRYSSIAQRQPPSVLSGSPSLIDDFLMKHAPTLRFRPEDDYMTTNANYPRLGYKERGLVFAFENNVPDGTLPLFWATGPSPDWEPLVRRT